MRRIACVIGGGTQMGGRRQSRHVSCGAALGLRAGAGAGLGQDETGEFACTLTSTLTLVSRGIPLSPQPISRLRFPPSAVLIPLSSTPHPTGAVGAPKAGEGGRRWQKERRRRALRAGASCSEDGIEQRPPRLTKATSSGTRAARRRAETARAARGGEPLRRRCNAGVGVCVCVG